MDMSFIVYVGNVSVGTAEGCVGDSRMERDWVIFVYGDQHQHVINHKLVRAFSKLFFEKSSAFVVLRLSPDPSFCFTKNKSMALEEARELLEEQQPGSLLLLMVFINDSSREHEVMEEDETESDTLLGFDKLMRILDEVDRLKKPLAEVDMLTDIDVTPVHNRLSKPWPSRQWNGKLLRLVCAAVSTKLPDLQQSVAAFIDGLFTVEFPQQVFFNGICPAVRSSSFWDWDMVYSLCDLLQLLQIAIPFNPHGLAILVENVEWFMERLPDRFWMEAPEEARNEINALAKSFHESISRQRVSVEEEYRPAWEVCDEMEPPGDFRMLPVQLMRNDIIRPVRPYIRRNKDSGGFNDMEEYLDIQFRLLREDFVCPMRDGIAVWKQHACDDTFLLQFRDAYEQLDLLIIEGVRIEGVQLKRSSGEILRYAKFQPTADVLDRSSKKLKFGQMIALSSDNFKEEALFATIVERPDDQLLEGRIGLSFTAESESHVSKAKIYTIVESNAYFEMYQHVFEVIKHFNSDMPVPFARYLVNAETNVKLPAYLERPLPTDTTVDSEHVNGPTELSVMGTKYPIKRLMYTLDGDKLGIDGYQRNALISALTSELAIVQGPPGTGKTFIGRLIVRVLFENMNLWNPARAYPVLVVCYTNHALDQFLEGLLNDFEEAGVSNDYPSIVRLGSRCKNERLKRCMKANVMEDYAGIIDEISRTEASISF
ncbi:NFX1-type zinc finger-containing protein 1 [Toxocara canis]|uniref:NFX1-type zinc finger-containing protein 1 n=1 Tax=Toxocara canis TaxID=6265 RepID=A0A0B2V457_TOXCA|nr:NFX1-type zinc finger-containing protein 1 [Toxocara canis]